MLQEIFNWMDDLCLTCIHYLRLMSRDYNITYESLNVILFIFLHPVFTFTYMVAYILKGHGRKANFVARILFWITTVAVVVIFLFMLYLYIKYTLTGQL